MTITKQQWVEAHRAGKEMLFDKLLARNAELLEALGLVPELLEAWHTDLAVQAHHRELADCDCAVAYKWRMLSAAIAAAEKGE